MIILPILTTSLVLLSLGVKGLTACYFSPLDDRCTMGGETRNKGSYLFLMYGPRRLKTSDEVVLNTDLTPAILRRRGVTRGSIEPGDTAADAGEHQRLTDLAAADK